MTKDIRRVKFCPHCSNRAPQRLICTQRYMERTWRADSGEETEPTPWSTFVAECETCRHLLLYDNPGDQFDENEFHLATLKFPEHGLHISVPSPIRAIYAEASRIRHLAPNAFAVQIRRALEALCDDRCAEGRTLFAQLKDLAKKNEIPSILVELTDVLRLLGNVGAHSGTQGVHDLQTRQIDEFFRVLVEYVYVAPNKLAAFRKRLGK